MADPRRVGKDGLEIMVWLYNDSLTPGGRHVGAISVTAISWLFAGHANGPKSFTWPFPALVGV